MPTERIERVVPPLVETEASGAEAARPIAGQTRRPLRAPGAPDRRRMAISTAVLDIVRGAVVDRDAIDVTMAGRPRAQHGPNSGHGPRA
jgi:hypothetical protein